MLKGAFSEAHGDNFPVNCVYFLSQPIISTRFDYMSFNSPKSYCKLKIWETYSSYSPNPFHFQRAYWMPRGGF